MSQAATNGAQDLSDVARFLDTPVKELVRISVRHSYYIAALDTIALIFWGFVLFMLYRLYRKVEPMKDGYTVVLPIKISEYEPLSVCFSNTALKMGTFALALIAMGSLLWTGQLLLERIINPEWMGLSDIVGLFTGR